MTDARIRAVVVAALACGAMVVALVIASDHQEDKAVWAVFGPLVAWNFVGTGLYAWRREPDSRTGMLTVLFGFAWSVAGLGFANSPLLYTLGFVVGSLGGGLLLHVVMGSPSGRLESRLDRAIVLAGYVVFRCVDPRGCCSGARTTFVATSARPACC